MRQAFLAHERISLRSEAVDRKRSRVLLWITCVEDTIEQRDLLHLDNLWRHAPFLHGLQGDIRSQDTLGHAAVVGWLPDHAPAAELAEPPHAERGMRIVAVAIREHHVELVLLCPAVADGVVAL